MSQRYPGGLIRKSAPVVVGPTGSPPEGGSAPGIWTLEQAAGYIKQGLWPKPLINQGLYSWGQNFDGQLGQNNTVDKSSPVKVGSLTPWSLVSSGYSTAAIKTDGTLWTWGKNNYGQLGQNDTIFRSSPVQVGALTDWSKVSISTRFCVAIKTNGTLWSWGQNSRGQLGLNNITNRSSPVQVGALTDWSKVSVGSLSCAAIKTNGTLWTWGFNNQGQLGQNTSYTIDRSSPVQVGALTDWSTASMADGYFCVATKTTGTLFTWGGNFDGQLGNNEGGSYTQRSSPIQVGALTTWSKVSGGQSTCASIKTDGTLWAWGGANYGQLGNNNRIKRSSPVQIGALTDWSQIATAEEHCISIKTDGTLWVWGGNGNGQLGQNNTISRSSPVQVGSFATWSTLGENRKKSTFAILS